MRCRHVLALVAVALAAMPWVATWAQALHQYPGADLAAGARLIAEHQCSACHIRKVGGDGAAIYRPAGRVNNPNSLLTMVERCSTELNLGLFPEDVAAVAAVLQRDHYRFPLQPARR